METKLSNVTLSDIDKMCKDKPARYKQMVISAVEKANTYIGLAGGSIASRQVIASIMLQIDNIYVEVK